MKLFALLFFSTLVLCLNALTRFLQTGYVASSILGLGICTYPQQSFPVDNDCNAYVVCSGILETDTVQWCQPNYQFDYIANRCGWSSAYSVIECSPFETCSTEGTTPYTLDQTVVFAGFDCSTLDDYTASYIPGATYQTFAMCLGGVAYEYYCCYGYQANVVSSVASCVATP